MKQPDIKFGKDIFVDWNEHMGQIANHFNIAKHHNDEAMRILLRELHDKLKYEDYRRLDHELGNTHVGIVGLGQELIRVEQYNYDYSTTEKPDWQNGYGMYDPREKKSCMLPIPLTREDRISLAVIARSLLRCTEDSGNGFVYVHDTLVPQEIDLLKRIAEMQP